MSDPVLREELGAEGFWRITRRRAGSDLTERWQPVLPVSLWVLAHARPSPGQGWLSQCLERSHRDTLCSCTSGVSGGRELKPSYGTVLLDSS